MSVAAVTGTEAAEELEMLRINLRHWREQSRLSFRYMPAALWGEVVVAARKYGVRKVACAVGVNLEDLIKRVGPCEVEPEPEPPKPPEPKALEFMDIELNPGTLPPPKPTPAPLAAAASPEAPAQRAADEAWLEVLAPDGTKLTLRMPVASLAAATTLVQEFRSRP